MEVKEKSKKRELIKSIAIVFLAVLLVLTFFSQTIMNRSLPEVATQLVTSGTINAKIRGSGTVSANESYEVVINQTREIRSVCVKVGDTVEQGDLLFVLGDVESQELRDAQEQLQNLNIDYQKQLLNLSKEYAQNDRSVQIIREDLEKATAQRDANLVTDAEVSYAKGDLASAKTQLSQISLLLEELNALMSDNEEYQEAKAAVDKWTAEVETLEKAVEDLKVELDKASAGNADLTDLKRQLSNAQTALTAAQRESAAAQESYKSTVNAHEVYYNALRIAAQNKMMQDGLDITDAAKLDAYMQSIAYSESDHDYPDLAEWKSAYQAIKDAEDALNKAQKAVDGANEDVKYYSELLATVSGDQDLISTLTQQYNQKSDDLSNAQYELNQANRDLAQVEGGNTALKNQIKDYESAKRQQEAVIETLNQNITDLEAKKAAYDAAVETIAAKERELEDALSGKDIDKQLDNLDLQSMRLQIEKQQELVNKYQQESVSTEITANVSGTISAINVSAGKENVAGSAMAVIDVVDRGYTLKIAVTNDQAKQVKVGDTASVTNYYWGNDITATLEAITADPSKPGQGKLLVFRVTGDVDAGTNLTLSIGQKSASYDTIVPKSALREDSNGSFVLVIVSKSTPLGNRYTATRADVQVLASDDTSAAVSGLSANDYVITTSSKPLDAGTLVRMVENP